MRAALAFALFGLSSCVAPQLRHTCPAACPGGEVCDTSVGECKSDPCGNLCSQAQRCRPGPPPRCIDVNVGEVKVNGPDEPSGPAEPPRSSVPGSQ